LEKNEDSYSKLKATLELKEKEIQELKSKDKEQKTDLKKSQETKKDDVEDRVKQLEDKLKKLEEHNLKLIEQNQELEEKLQHFEEEEPESTESHLLTQPKKPAPAKGRRRPTNIKKSFVASETDSNEPSILANIPKTTIHPPDTEHHLSKSVVTSPPKST